MFSLLHNNLFKWSSVENKELDQQGVQSKQVFPWWLCEAKSKNFEQTGFYDKFLFINKKLKIDNKDMMMTRILMMMMMDSNDDDDDNDDNDDDDDDDDM